MNNGFELLIYKLDVADYSNNFAFQSYRPIDLYEDFDIDLTYQIAEIQDLSQRTSSYSKQFIIPISKNNRDAFDFIGINNVDHLMSYPLEPDPLNSGGESERFVGDIQLPFIPKEKVRCKLLYNKDIIFEGFLRMTSIKKDEIADSYEIVIYSDEADLYTALGDYTLSDMVWSEMDHTYTPANVINSWTNDNTGSKYYYPLIDYNNNWLAQNVKGINLPSGAKIDLRTENFFPATPVYYIMKKIFSGAGFKWKSTFLESETFKNLYIPMNNVPMLRGSYDMDEYIRAGRIIDFKESRQFHVGLSTTVGNTDLTPVRQGSTTQYIYNGNLRFLDETTNPYQDRYGLFNTNSSFSAFKNVSTDSTYKSRFSVELQFNDIPPNNNGQYLAIQIFREVNPTTGATAGGWNSGYGYPVPIFGSIQPLTSGYLYVVGYTGGTSSNITNPGTNIPDDNITFSGSGGSIASVTLTTDWLDNTDPNHTALYPNEQVRIQVSYMKFGFNQAAATVKVNYMSNFRNEVTLDVIKGSKIDYYNILPKNIKLTDFFASICKMFNLHIEAVKGEYNTLFIEPRDQFYQSGITENWTKYLDVDTLEDKILVDSDNRFYKFAHKEDKDYFNTKYKDGNNNIFGTFVYNTNNDFGSGTKDITTIFSPTPMSRLNNALTGSSNIIIPQILKEFTGSNSVNGNKINQSAMESNIRILTRNSGDVYFAQPSGIPSGDYFRFEGNQYTKYPYIGDVDHPITPSRSINWGTPNGLYYTTEDYTDNNLVNLYYLNMLKEYTNNDSRLLTVEMFLPSNVIRDFSFAKNIALEINTPGQQSGSTYYYKVSKISGYSPTNDGLCKVELIKTLYSFNPKFDGKILTNVGPIDTTPTQGGGSSQFRTTPTNTNTPNTYNTPQTGVLATNNTNNITGTGVVATGYQNSISGSNVMALGSSNIVSSSADQSIVSGSGNNIQSPAFVMGNNNTVKPGLTNVLILGDGVVAQQSNVIYSTNPTIQYINYITAGRDNIIEPFNANNINFISAGRDEVLSPFADNIINSLSAGYDEIL